MKCPICGKQMKIGMLDPEDRWAIFTDLITQADKAERLQKAIATVLKEIKQLIRGE